MNIVIVGCGEVGATLAAELGEEDNNITVVDLSPERVRELTDKLDVMGVVGNGSTHTTLAEAGIEDADLLIAVTESDELNLLCCIIAKKTGNCRVIARVRSPEYRTELDYLKNELGLAMLINPEFATAEEIAGVLRFPVANMIERFAKGKVELIKFRLNEENKIVGMSVKDMIVKLHCDVLVCTVERGDEVHIANGNFVFRAGDLVSLISTPKNSVDFFKKIGYRGHSIKNAIIVGAGNIAHYLCDLLKGSGISLKVIDASLEKCNELASKHPEVVVINGDKTDREMLIEEGIEAADAFVILSDNDEENILLSLFAKGVGVPKIITKIVRTDYDDIVNHLDFDTVIYPKMITSDMIVRYVRAMKNTLGSNVEVMYSLIRGTVEASQFIVKEGSEITREPIARLAFKDDVLIAAVIRDGKLLIPRGQDLIQPDDTVIVVSKILGLKDLSDILK